MNPERKRLPHFPPVQHHAHPVVLFVTVCMKARQPLLSNEIAHTALIATWRDITNWHVGDYVIMPDHAHLFCVPGELNPPNVQQWVKYWKRVAGHKHTPFKNNWQDDCWDTQIRDLAHYDEKLSYVRMNPVRKGLASTPQEWPYQGRLHEIRW
jgi:putative transposase